MKILNFFLLLPIFFLTSCSESSSTLSTERHPEFFSIKDISQPQYICDFSDGRKLFRIELGYGTGYSNNSHFVYFFNSSKEVSINFNEKSGKVSVNKTIVQLPE